MIKNIVLSGGFYYGFLELGVLYHLAEEEYFSIDNIEAIYGTSAGGMIAAMMVLKLPFKDVLDYAIKRPWHKAIRLDPIRAFHNKGLISHSLFKTIFENLLKAAGLEVEITMQELYEHSGVDLHVFAIEFDTFDIVDISHKTFPNLSLVSAVHMTCALPYLVEPCLLDGKYYIDGGLTCNYPVDRCLEDGGLSTETLGVKLTKGQYEINEKSNIFEYAYCLHLNMGRCIEFHKEAKPDVQTKIKEVIVEIDKTSAKTGYKTFTEEKIRQELVDKGIGCAKVFLSKTNI